jgi:hypothetical protein
MKLFNRTPKAVEEDKLREEERLRKIDYYTFTDPCYECGQPIVNAAYYPNHVVKTPWNGGLSGAPVTAYRSVSIKTDPEWSIPVTKIFYHHHKCPDHVVEIPKEILDVLEKRSY